MALGERSEKTRRFVTYEFVKVNQYRWIKVMTHACGTEFLSLRTTHAQYRILCKNVLNRFETSLKCLEGL